MKRSLRPLTSIAVSVVVALLLLLALVFLPHSDYVRFQQLSRESVHYLRVQWIYERIHFDRTPIDIAFIGTSHTQSGISSQLVEKAMTDAGQPAHVVNFAVPHLGRDLEFLVARELLENRKVHTLVIEMQPLESRSPHPGFQRLATVGDIATAPMLINTGLLENWARLPLRQVTLATKTAFADRLGYRTHFDPSSYEGVHYDDTLHLHGFSQPRIGVFDRAHFRTELAAIDRDMTDKNAAAAKVAKFGGNLLYRYNDYYMRSIMEMARQRQVKLVFLYLPYLDASLSPDNLRAITGSAPLLIPQEVIQTPGFWQNGDHLNYYGAQSLSRWSGAQLAALRAQ